MMSLYLKRPSHYSQSEIVLYMQELFKLCAAIKHLITILVAVVEVVVVVVIVMAVMAQIVLRCWW